MSIPTPADPAAATSDVTSLLLRWGAGDNSALEQLTPIVYEDLIRIARARLRREPQACTMQPTALVHEAYLRLADQTRLRAENREHFFAIAANTLRRILVEHARKRASRKRDGGIRVTLSPDFGPVDRSGPDLLVLDEALQKLAQFDERKSRIIDLKFFGGLSAAEIGRVVGISVATVGRELRLGQAWLRREMSHHAV